MPVYNHIPKIEDDMKGATSSAAGKAGLVPAPTAGERSRALMADGTWKIPPNAINANNLSGMSIYRPEIVNEEGIPVVLDIEGKHIMNIGTVLRLYNTDKRVVAYLSYQDNYVGQPAVILTPSINDTKLVLGSISQPTEIAESLKVELDATINRNCTVVGILNSKQVNSDNDHLQLFGKNSCVMLDNIAKTGNGESGLFFAPVTTETTRLGHGNAKWSAVYAVTSDIVTSDRNLKKDINPFNEAYEKLFFDLEPSTFKLKNGESNRTHAGFISQDVEKALAKNGLSALDFAGFCKDQKTKIITDENGEEKEVPVEGEYIYSLRYEEFIALNTHMIQQLYHKVESLEQKLRENGIEV